MNGILLFDIDGTLITRPPHGRSPGLSAMNAAAKRMTGLDGLANQVSFAGATDLDVSRQLLELGGIFAPSAEQKIALLEHYVQYMKAFIQEDAYCPLGQPNDVIPRLRQAGHVIGLGTGNIKEGAHVKLVSAGIDHLFDMDLGGFGEDAEQRADILQIGADRCRISSGLSSAPVIIVGDTEKDVNAAKAIGAHCIGVPFGHHTAESLSEAGADFIVEEINNELITAIERIL
ncbi:MAG: HAD family hydrolase [Deltaproteobacteria bacterium]|nr:HAD family hydrolase [Deltaproteobacteria bacterium]MBN2670637.1 HAD family hydrolase [Deltaproteobacteria bacterium]